MKNNLTQLAALLCLGFASQGFAATWTSSLGSCTQTGGNGVITESDKLQYNRITVLNDLNKAVIFRCFVDLRSDKAITKIQVDATTDSAVTVKDLPADHADMKYYLPTCRLEINYSPGGNDFVELNPTKSVPWGHYNKFEVVNPVVQHAGNGYAQSAILQCQTPYYADATRFYGLRISYAD